jgi:hypothetical protein
LNYRRPTNVNLFYLVETDQAFILKFPEFKNARNDKFIGITKIKRYTRIDKTLCKLRKFLNYSVKTLPLEVFVVDSEDASTEKLIIMLLHNEKVVFLRKSLKINSDSLEIMRFPRKASNKVLKIDMTPEYFTCLCRDRLVKMKLEVFEREFSQRLRADRPIAESEFVKMFENDKYRTYYYDHLADEFFMRKTRFIWTRLNNKGYKIEDQDVFLTNHD